MGPSISSTEVDLLLDVTERAPPGAASALTDRHARRISYLRVSVTDRCNYRCSYCMPAAGWARAPRGEIATLEEIHDIVGLMAGLGVERVRLTGGEPTVRRGIIDLVSRIAATPGIREVVMTTNGHLLDRFAEPLHSAGLRGLNVSLDTLDRARFAEITRGGDLDRVLAGLDAARAAGFEGTKVNTVAIRGVNEDELADLARFCWDRDLVPRFIELMPIGQLAFFGPDHILPTAEILERIAVEHRLVPSPRSRSTAPRGPAAYWRVSGGSYAGREVGVISPMSDDGFCAACNRARLTSRGTLRACLGNDDEVDLLSALRAGAGVEEQVELVRKAVHGKLPAHRMHTMSTAPRTVMTALGG